MSFAATAIIEFLGIAVLLPALLLGIAVALFGRPAWLGGRGGRRGEPGIQAFLMIVVLTVVAVALVFVAPFVVALGSLPKGETVAVDAALAVLMLLGVVYAWRRGVLRWD
jgi:hypothetical protein